MVWHARLLGSTGACFPEEHWGPELIRQLTLGCPAFFAELAGRRISPLGSPFAVAVDGEAEILSLGVLPNSKALRVWVNYLDAVCGEARLRGAEYIFLECHLIIKRRLYYTLGAALSSSDAAEITTTEQKVWGDALIMRAPLARAEGAT